MDATDEVPRAPEAPDRAPHDVEAPDRPHEVEGPADAAHLDQPAELLLLRNRARGVQPDPHTNHPSYARDSLIPWRIGAAAWEAVDPP